jgi:hypothetical protein
LKGEVFEGSASELEQAAMLKFFQKLDPLNLKYITTDGDIRMKSALEGFQWSETSSELLRDLSHVIKCPQNSEKNI